MPAAARRLNSLSITELAGLLRLARIAGLCLRPLVIFTSPLSALGPTLLAAAIGGLYFSRLTRCVAAPTTSAQCPIGVRPFSPRPLDEGWS